MDNINSNTGVKKFTVVTEGGRYLNVYAEKVIRRWNKAIFYNSSEVVAYFRKPRAYWIESHLV